MGSQNDLDQGGFFRETTRIYQGPSIGWTQGAAPSTSAILVTTAGTTNIQPGISLVHVNVAGSVTIQLPTSRGSPAGAGAQPGTWLQRLVSVNDLGGNAGTYPITVLPVAGETIAGSPSATISGVYGIINLLADVQNGGWSLVSGSTGISGGLADAPSDGTLYGRRNATWTAVVAPSVTISDTAPASPSAGNFWWNSTTGQLGIYYNDGTSSQWVVVGAASASSLGGTGGSTPIVYTTAVIGAGTYVIPAGYSNLVGEAWGAGGSGAGVSIRTGGGGGGYSKFNIPVTVSQTIYYNVGAGGAGSSSNGNNGSNSWINPAANAQPTSSGCVGGGGGGAAPSPGAGGPGSVGTTNYQGGAGGTVTGSGGGGGGGAGSAGNGSDASGGTHGAGGVPDGGAGSDGVASGTAAAGGTPGGGSGSSAAAGSSGPGGPGQIRLTIT